MPIEVLPFNDGADLGLGADSARKGIAQRILRPLSATPS